MAEKVLLHKECPPQISVWTATKMLAIYNQKRIARILQPSQVDWSEQINFVSPSPHNWVDVFHVIVSLLFNSCQQSYCCHCFDGILFRRNQSFCWTESISFILFYFVVHTVQPINDNMQFHFSLVTVKIKINLVKLRLKICC